MSAELAIYCTKELRGQWPDPLARHWRSEYPNLFDDDDLRLVLGQQPHLHFKEWFTAVHLFHSIGALSLVEKYRRGNAHRQNRSTFERLVTPDQRKILSDICESCSVQLPDLLVYWPDRAGFGFVEVKGSDETVSAGQRQSHADIKSRLNVSVEIVRVHILASRPKA